MIYPACGHTITRDRRAASLLKNHSGSRAWVLPGQTRNEEESIWMNIVDDE
jgi:hypothetical protein